MAEEDAVIAYYLFRFLLFGGVVFILMRYYGLSIRSIYNTVYAWLLNKFGDRMNKLVAKKKQKLFEGLHDVVGNVGPITILEIGAGAGANFRYYPDKSFVICLEPKIEFDKYIDRNIEKANPKLRFETVHGFAEDMRSIPSNSIDAVVATLVLCSVSNLDATLQEVRRVLKVGCSLYYMEHVSAGDEDPILDKIQKFINPLWRLVADGCEVTRKPWLNVEKAGFSRAEYERFPLKVKFFRTPVTPHVMGIATK